MIEMGEGKRKRGRPHIRWMSSDQGYNTDNELREVTRDRIGWIQLNVDVTRIHTT